MTARLAYFDRWTHPVAGDLIAKHPGIEPVRLEVAGDPESVQRQLRSVHGYQSLIRTEASKRPGIADTWLPGATLIDECPDLLAVCSAGAGYDVIDVDACTAAGIIVCTNAGPGREAVAEHAVGLMLSLSKRIALADRLIRTVPICDRSIVRGTELAGRTVGVVGLGQIGSRVAEICRLGFGMEVLAYDPFQSDDRIAEQGVHAVDFEALLARSDYVQVTCPLTDETRGLFGADAFAAMKPTAYFITTSRGQVHDEQALLDALRAGEIAGAGLDVFHQEPPPVDHPLFTLPNVVATPHSAGITDESTYRIGVATAEQWITIFDAKVPPRLVNPRAWPRYRRRFEKILGVLPPPLAPRQEETAL